MLGVLIKQYDVVDATKYFVRKIGFNAFLSDIFYKNIIINWNINYNDFTIN